jgi:mycothiol synthase
VFRPLHPSDAEAVHRLIRRCEQADGIPIVTPLEEVVQMFDEPYFDPGLDGWVTEDDGELVAWGRVYHTPSTERLERAFLLGDVHPDWRRRGLGRRLIDLQRERATSLLHASDHDLPRFVRAQAYEWRHDATALFEAAGLTAVRYHDELIRPLESLSAPSSPAGVILEGFTDSHAEPCRILMNTAFADHWGSSPRSAEAWASMLEEYGQRPDLSFVAVSAAGEIVGATLNFHVPEDQEVTGRLDGWIGMLGVLRPWRKRGVASALIVASLHAFARAGFTHAMLGVDSANPSGAYSLYTGLGFQPLHRSVTYELRV